jgi:phenylalanyl-tRNA synthetase beta chain
VHGDLLDKVGQSKDLAFKLTNALSPDLQYLRFHALPSLLDKVHANIKSGYDSFTLFELNKGHATDALEGGLPVEFEMLDLVFASKKPLEGAAFYHARRYLDAVAGDFGLTLRYEAINDESTMQSAATYDQRRSAFVYAGQTFLGIIGEFKRSVTKQLKLPAYCAGFSIDQQFLLAARSGQGKSYRPLPKFPKIEQDICLRTSRDVSFARVHTLLKDGLETHKPADTVMQIAPLDIYQDDPAYVQTTFRIGLASHLKTMTDQEMSKLLDKFASQAATDLGAERV